MAGPGEPLASLRGAGVSKVDAEKVATVAGAISMGALAVVAVLLLVAGAHTNSQIDALRQRGVPVQVTVTGCLGLLGGSGSNAAGYACTGAFTLDGRRHVSAIPGNVLRDAGTKIRGITVPGDPALLTTPAVLAGEHSSPKVYALPAGLLLLAVLGAGALRWSAKRRGSRVASGGAG